MSCPKQCLEVDKSVINKMGYNPTRYKGDCCIGCGVCFYTCPEPFAITVYKKEA
jgi:NAD-dependent dihydropyrimidine dehydrogenase PreA subunit